VRTRIIGWLLAACVATFGFQTDPKSKASIEGQVVSQATGAPLRNAVVKLVWHPSPGIAHDPIVQRTNEEGRFLFANLQPGDWEVSAERRGFVPGYYGGRKFLLQGSRISLKADQQIRDLVLKLVPQATISGRVLDTEGEPVEGARVAILKARYANGVSRWSEVASATTLDNGDYRIPRVAAGRYLVRCKAEGFEPSPSLSKVETAFATTYHPNVTDPSLATAINVEDGAEVGGIDIRVATTGVFHVRGRLPTTDRQGGRAQLVERSDPSKVLAETVVRPPGYLIDFPRIPPGTYTAYGWTMEGTVFRASQPVGVRDQDVDSLVLSPAPADEVQGNVRVKTDDRKVTLSALSVVIRPIALGTSPSTLPSPVKIGDDLKFRYLIGQRSFVSFSVEVSRFPEGCYLASVRYGGKEVPDSAIEYLTGATLEITIGTDGARVDGSALNKDDTPFEGAVVALIPADGKAGSRSVVSGPRGAFHLTGVPPGEYKLMAWDDVERDDLENPDFTKRFESQSTPVKLPASGTATVSPKVISREIAQ
jgi:hypothetical protein